MTKTQSKLAKRFARNLAQDRKEEKLTCAALAARVGVSREYVSMLEAGKREPSLYMVERFARALGWTDPTELLKDYDL